MMEDVVAYGASFWDAIKGWLTGQGLELSKNVLIALVILLVGKYVIKLIVASVMKALERAGKKDSLFARFVASVISKVCWAVLVVTVLGRLGVNVGPLVAGLGVTGFILGFAFQESLGNLASGLMISINEPFKIGDYVIVAGLEGTVLKVDMMATVLATSDNKKVVVPNKSAWGAPITNFSALGKRRVDLTACIDYGTDVAKAIKVAVAALADVPGVAKDPAPSVSVGSLMDNKVTLNVRPWCEGAAYWGVYSASYEAVKTAFAREGINLPMPHTTVHQA